MTRTWTAFTAGLLGVVGGSLAVVFAVDRGIP